ncbi:MAG: 6-phosphogluconolactonase [Thermodesulfobacteriota bacterium]
MVIERVFKHPSLLINEMGEESRIKVLIFEDLPDLSRRAADIFIESAKEELRKKKFFTVLLSGGKTPKKFYKMLGSADMNERVPWDKTYLFWGDERCVNPTHPDSNYYMVKKAMLDKLDIPPENVHQMHGELMDGAALLYEEELESFFMAKYKRYIRLPVFDLVLLGLGTNGHILSLFPGSSALEVQNRMVMDIEEDGINVPQRLTMTLPVVNNSTKIVFLVSGKEKGEILKETLEGNYDPKLYPAQGIRPTSGELIYLVDRDAARLLSD